MPDEGFLSDLSKLSERRHSLSFAQESDLPLGTWLGHELLPFQLPRAVQPLAVDRDDFVADCELGSTTFSLTGRYTNRGRSFAVHNPNPRRRMMISAVAHEASHYLAGEACWYHDRQTPALASGCNIDAEHTAIQ